jgi:hypothetical protein
LSAAFSGLLLLFVAYIVTATSGVLDGGNILELKAPLIGHPMPCSERKYALKFIAVSLFMWIFVFSIPLGMIEQHEPRFLSLNLPVAFITAWWSTFLPLELVDSLSTAAAGWYAMAAWLTCIGPSVGHWSLGIDCVRCLHRRVVRGVYDGACMCTARAPVREAAGVRSPASAEDAAAARLPPSVLGHLLVWRLAAKANEPGWPLPK